MDQAFREGVALANYWVASRRSLLVPSGRPTNPETNYFRPGLRRSSAGHNSPAWGSNRIEALRRDCGPRQVGCWTRSSHEAYVRSRRASSGFPGCWACIYASDVGWDGAVVLWCAKTHPLAPILSDVPSRNTSAQLHNSQQSRRAAAAVSRVSCPHSVPGMNR